MMHENAHLLTCYFDILTFDIDFPLMHILLSYLVDSFRHGVNSSTENTGIKCIHKLRLKVVLLLLVDLHSATLNSAAHNLSTFYQFQVFV